MVSDVKGFSARWEVEHELHECTNGTNEEKVVYKELSFKIIEACFEVHNILGPGYSEKIYEEAVSRELRNRGMQAGSGCGEKNYFRT